MSRLSGETTVDAHQHFWKIGFFKNPSRDPSVPVLYRDYLPGDLKPLIDNAGVNTTIVVQCRQMPGEGVAETRWHLRLADEYPFIAGVVGWVDLTNPTVGRTLDELQPHPKLKAIRHPVEFESTDDWLVREETIHGLRELAHRGIAYDLLVRTKHLRHIPVLYDLLPDLRMVVEHIAKPDIRSGAIDTWATAMDRVSRIPSLYCKLSGMITEADPHHWKPADLKPYVRKVIESFGYDRVMYGSDWPVCNLAGSYQEQLDALVEALGPMTDEQRAKVFGRNARDFYHLD